jgi:hypothetical protein
VRHDKTPAPIEQRSRSPVPNQAIPLGTGALELPPYPPAIPGAPPPQSSGPGAPVLDFSVPPVIVKPPQ